MTFERHGTKKRRTKDETIIITLDAFTVFILHNRLDDPIPIRRVVRYRPNGTVIDSESTRIKTPSVQQPSIPFGGNLSNLLMNLNLDQFIAVASNACAANSQATEQNTFLPTEFKYCWSMSPLTETTEEVYTVRFTVKPPTVERHQPAERTRTGEEIVLVTLDRQCKIVGIESNNDSCASTPPTRVSR